MDKTEWLKKVIEEELKKAGLDIYDEVEALKSVLGVKKYQGLPSLPSIEEALNEIREKAPPMIKCPYCGGVMARIGKLLLYRCTNCRRFINLRAENPLQG